MTDIITQPQSFPYNVSTNVGPGYQDPLSLNIYTSGELPYDPTGGGGSTPTGDTTGGGGALPDYTFETVDTGGQDDILSEINSTYEPAINALNDFANSLKAALPGQIANAQQEGGLMVSQTQAEQQRRQQEFAGQRQTEQGRTKSAIAEARRQGSELLQGLQARFGSSTGTGAFIGELSGREVLKNIAGNRQALQQTLGQIQLAENDMNTKVQNLVTQINLETNKAVQSLKDNLIERLAQLAIAKGDIESQKGEMKIDLLNQFRQERMAVEQRNTELMNKLAEARANAQNSINSFKDSALERFVAYLEAADISGYRPTLGTYEQGIKTLDPAKLRYTNVASDNEYNIEDLAQVIAQSQGITQ